MPPLPIMVLATSVPDVVSSETKTSAQGNNPVRWIPPLYVPRHPAVPYVPFVPCVPMFVVWKAPPVVGKSELDVVPVTYMCGGLAVSSTIAVPTSMTAHEGKNPEVHPLARHGVVALVVPPRYLPICCTRPVLNVAANAVPQVVLLHWPEGTV